MRKASELIATYARELAKTSENPARVVRKLLAFILGVESDHLFFHPQIPVSKDQERQLKTLVERFKKNEPVSKIIGQKEFYSRVFITSQDVLDPRPETELMIDLAKKYVSAFPKPLKILDLGTGSGCILITLMLEVDNLVEGGIQSGVGVDISEPALSIAAQNVKKFQQQERIHLIQSNWFSNIPMESKFSLIVANPPYITQTYPLDLNVLMFDPHVALFGGEEGLDAYYIIAKNIRQYLDKGGLFMCEIGQGQENAVRDIFENAGFTFKECVCDFAGIQRIAIFA